MTLFAASLPGLDGEENLFRQSSTPLKKGNMKLLLFLGEVGVTAHSGLLSE